MCHESLLGRSVNPDWIQLGWPHWSSLLYLPSFSGTSRLDLEFSFHENHWHVDGIVSHNIDLTKKLHIKIVATKYRVSRCDMLSMNSKYSDSSKHSVKDKGAHIVLLFFLTVDMIFFTLWLWIPVETFSITNHFNCVAQGIITGAPSMSWTSWSYHFRAEMP